MYKICFINDNFIESIVFCKTIEEVNKYAQGFGADGAMVKWFNSDLGIFNYYWKIVAFVEKEPLSCSYDNLISLKKSFIEKMLENMDRKDLKNLIVNYIEYSNNINKVDFRDFVLLYNKN